MKPKADKHVLIQSLWTAGAAEARTYVGGWSNPADHWYATALSACRLRKLYPDRHLVFVGDAVAAQAITDLQLPYNEITDALEGFQAMACSLNAGRLAAQLTVKIPYYHVDNDVLLFKQMPTWLDSHRAVAWSVDPPPGTPHGFKATIEPAAMALSNALNYVPESWSEFLHEGGAFASSIVGGRDVDFLHDTAETSLKVLVGLENQDAWSAVASADKFLAQAAGNVIEKLTLYTQSRSQGVPITTVFSEEEIKPTNYDRRAAELGLLHYGNHKTHPLAHHWRTRTKLLLRNEFPDTYKRVKTWLGDTQVELRVINVQAAPGCIYWNSGLCGRGEFNGTPSYNDCRNRCQKRSDASDKRTGQIPFELKSLTVPGPWTGDATALRTSLTVLKERQKTCDACVHGIEKDQEGHATKCSSCGCPLAPKQQITTQTCPWITEEYPKGKWGERVVKSAKSK